MAARKNDKELNETLNDLQQNEDERGCFQPLWKMDTEAAERTPSRTANALRRLDERRTDGDENRSCEPPSPGLAALPFIFKPWVFFGQRRAQERSERADTTTAPERTHTGRVEL